jgi:hypothetical protein
MTTGYDSVDYSTDPSLVPDPHPQYDPIWAAATKHDMPVSCHLSRSHHEEHRRRERAG